MTKKKKAGHLLMGDRGSDELRGAVSALHFKCRVNIWNSQALERMIINCSPLQHR